MSRRDLSFPQIATGDLDIPVVRQLPAANLPLGDEFKPGPMKVVGFETALGRGGQFGRARVGRVRIKEPG